MQVSFPEPRECGRECIGTNISLKALPGRPLMTRYHAVCLIPASSYLIPVSMVQYHVATHGGMPVPPF